MISQFYMVAEVTMFAEVYRMGQCVCVHTALDLILTVGQGTAMYQLNSFSLIASELIMACPFIVSAQAMMLVYGTWTTDMPRSKKEIAKRREDYIYWRPSGVPWSPPLCPWLLRGRRTPWR